VPVLWALSGSFPIFSIICVVAPLGIAFEEGDRAFVSANLHGIVFAPEIGWGGGVQFVDLFLRSAIGRRGQSGVNVAARNKSFQLSAGLGVVLHHLVGKFLFVAVTLFAERPSPRQFPSCR